MIELACPNCGRTGSVPRDKQHSRLVCKKCHMVFHMNAAGRTLLGEPPAELAKKTEAHAPADKPHLPSIKELSDIKSNLSEYEFPVKPIGIGAAVILLGIGFVMLGKGSPESLTDRASATTSAFARDDLAHLKQIASPETVDDVIRWYDQAHNQLDHLKTKWATKDTMVRVLVIDEDRSNRRGLTDAFVYPSKSPSRSEAIVSELDASGKGPREPLEIHLHWVLDGRGKWRLDGHNTFQTLARVAAN